MRVGPQVPKLTHVPTDALKAGDGGGGGELPGDSPPRVAPDGAQTPLEGQVGDLDDDAVDLEVELAPAALPGKALGDDLVLGAQQLHVSVDAEPVGAQPAERLPVRGERQPLGDADLVAPDRQRPFGSERGVELAHGAGRGVAGVHERREPLLGAALVERGEVAQGHVQLAPHLQQRGRILDVQGNRADGAQVVGDVLPHLPVPAGGAAHEHPVAVDEADGQAVDLRLDHVGEARLGRPFAGEVVAHTLDPRAELLGRAGVGEREHGLQVGDLLQPADRGAPHPLRGRVGGAQLGVRVLQRGELGEQRVVGVVADDGVVEHVVAVRVVLDLAP